MRVVFAGTPAFACPALAALVAADYQVSGVLTQPDRPAGRGRQMAPSPVKLQAELLGLPVHAPADKAAAEAVVGHLKPDVVVVVAYGLLLPASLLAIPHHGCLNIHASLLPRWRGAAPIARAIEAGDEETGITIMQMDEGLDTGPMLARVVTPIGDNETGAELASRLAELGARTVLPVLAALRDGRGLVATPQPSAGASYARKLRKEEARLDWTRDAWALTRQIRAFTPWPGTSTVIDGLTVKIGAASPTSAEGGKPGQVVATHPDLTIGTGRGSLLIRSLQAPGGRPQSPTAFLQKHPLPVGAFIG